MMDEAQPDGGSRDERRPSADLEALVGLRLLADAMPQLIWTAGSDGVVDYYNARVEDYGGWSVEGGEYQWHPLVHPDDLAATMDTWARAADAGSVYEAEHRMLMADGEYRWHLSRAVPVPIEGGRTVKWFGTATDVHARKLAEEHQASIAHSLQAALMPASLPSSERYRLAARYRPASTGEDVGGDWYDAFADDGRLFLVIGDAAGHGIGAAAVMGAARHAVGTALTMGRRPDEALAVASEYLERLDGAFVTCLVVAVDLDARQLELAAAGHVPPLLLVPGASPRTIDVSPRPPLGVAGRPSVASTVALPASPATVVLITDGLIERRHRSIDDGLARLRAVLADAADDEPDAICDRLVGTFDHVDDDVAVLVARV